MSLQNFSIIERSTGEDKILYCNTLKSIDNLQEVLPVGSCVLYLKSLGIQLTVIVEELSVTVSDVLNFMLNKISINK